MRERIIGGKHAGRVPHGATNRPPSMWTDVRTSKAIAKAKRRHAERVTKNLAFVPGRKDSVRELHIFEPEPKMAQDIKNLSSAPTPVAAMPPLTTADTIKKEWSRGKKLAVGAGVASAAALAGYGAYRLWKKRKQSQQKEESLLSSLDEIRVLALDEGFEFDNESLLLALGEASEHDNDLATDLLYLIDDADDSELVEEKDEERSQPLQTFAYGGAGDGDTEAGGFFGGFGQSLGVGLGTAAAAGLTSKKGRRAIAKFLGFKKRPTDKNIKKMMKKIKQGGLNAEERGKLEKMLKSVSSREPAGRNIAIALGGGAALGAGAMYAYNKWKQKRQNRNMHRNMRGVHR